MFSMGFTSNAFGGHTTLKTSHISRLFSVNLPRSQSRPQKPSCSSSLFINLFNDLSPSDSQLVGGFNQLEKY